MANKVPFNTLAFTKKLEARGVEVKQARAHAEVLAEVLEANFITKNDSDSVINHLVQEINTLRSQMQIKFLDITTQKTDVKSDFLKWLLGISFAQAAVIISMLKFSH